MANTYMQDVMNANFAQIGKLVKQWATGEEYLHMRDPTGNLIPFPTPASGGPAALAALQRQFDVAGANLNLEAHFTNVTVVQGDSDTFVLKLPAKQFIDSNEVFLRNTAKTYALPAFYAAAIDDPAHTTQGTADQREIFDLQRVGDYSISNCC